MCSGLWLRNRDRVYEQWYQKRRIKPDISQNSVSRSLSHSPSLSLSLSLALSLSLSLALSLSLCLSLSLSLSLSLYAQVTATKFPDHACILMPGKVHCSESQCQAVFQLSGARSGVSNDSGRRYRDSEVGSLLQEHPNLIKSCTVAWHPGDPDKHLLHD